MCITMLRCGICRAVMQRKFNYLAYLSEKSSVVVCFRHIYKAKYEILMNGRFGEQQVVTQFLRTMPAQCLQNCIHQSMCCLGVPHPLYGYLVGIEMYGCLLATGFESPKEVRVDMCARENVRAFM